MKTGILIGGLFLALLVAAVVVVDMVRIPDMYSVKGEATVKYLPDKAKIEASVIQTADVSADAVQAVADGMRNVLDALKMAGVGEADIASRTIETHLVTPEHDSYSMSKTKLHLYIAQQTIVVTLRDLSMVPKAAGAISDAGSNQWRVSYSVEDETKIKAAAAKAAFEDAIKKADIYAAAGGFKRGRLLKLADSVVSFPTLGDDEQTSYGNGAVEEIIVTARRRDEKAATLFTVPKPEEKSIDATVTLLLATR
jgi:uncharacterized protein YggE